MSARVVLLLSLLVTAPARGQAPVDLGVIRVRLPPPVRVSAFMILVRPGIPEVRAVDLPTEIGPALADYREAADALRAAARGRAPRTSVDLLARRERTGRARLIAGLHAARASLSPVAQLLLGWLEYETAADTMAVALEAAEACIVAGRADCAEPTLADDMAIATWTAITGDDVVAAHARLELAWSLHERGEDVRAEALLTAAVATSGLPDATRASGTFLLASLTADAARAAARYSEVAALGVPDLSLHAALHAGAAFARAGRVGPAITMLDRLFDPSVHADPAMIADARLILGDLIARGGAGVSLPDTLPREARARALEVGAEALAEADLLTWATADLDRAAALAPGFGGGELRTRIATRRGALVESPAAWLARATASCARGVESETGPLEVSVQFLPARAPRVRVVHASGARQIARCLGTHAPPTEGPLAGRFQATLALVP